jgi:hypothetical protein
MRCFPLGRLVLLTFACLFGLGGPVRAGDFFRRLCHKDCNTEVVNLPAQQVVVETSRPRVIMQETVRTHQVGVAAAPFVATIYAPMAMPVASFGTVGLANVGGPTTLDTSTALSSLHNLEQQAVGIAKLRAAHEMELQAAQRVYERIGALSQGLGTSTTKATDIAAELQKLTQRVDNLEKLVTIHDQALRANLPRVDAVERLTTIHDQVLNQMMKSNPPSNPQMQAAPHSH